MLLYLDQNYASRVAKFLLGQGSHAHFGALYGALQTCKPLIPPSPFHVLELRGGYLLPTFKTFFAEFSRGYWVRPWQEVVARQGSGAELRPEELLSREGSWEAAADLRPLEGVLEWELQGGFLERAWGAQDALGAHLGLSETPPFAILLARLLAFRSLERERYTRPSDLLDLAMAATVGPYVDALATDRYLREMMGRVGYPRPVYSGRRFEVARLTADVASRFCREPRSWA